MNKTHEITLQKMVATMTHLKDNKTFRWFQTSTPSHDGMGAVPGPTLRVTMGQVRRELKLTLKEGRNA